MTTKTNYFYYTFVLTILNVLKFSLNFSLKREKKIKTGQG